MKKLEHLVQVVQSPKLVKQAWVSLMNVIYELVPGFKVMFPSWRNLLLKKIGVIMDMLGAINEKTTKQLYLELKSVYQVKPAFTMDGVQNYNNKNT